MIGLIFGLDGTLVDADGLAAAAFDDVLTAYARRAHRAIDDAARRRAIDDLTEAESSGSYLAGTVGDELSRLVGGHFSADEMQAAFRHAAGARVQSVARPRPGARLAVERIQSLAIPATVLTWQSSAVARHLAALAGFRGAVLAAEDIGAAAFTPAALVASASALGIPPEFIRVVSARPNELAAAADAGMRAVRVGGDALLGDDDSLEAIPTLAELPALVAANYTRSLLGLRHVMRTALEWRTGHYIPGLTAPD